jgi:hypothetical protein
MRQTHAVGEKRFADRPVIPCRLFDGLTGEVRAATIFFAVLHTATIFFAVLHTELYSPSPLQRGAAPLDLRHVDALTFLAGCRRRSFAIISYRAYHDLATHWARPRGRARKPRRFRSHSHSHAGRRTRRESKLRAARRGFIDTIGSVRKWCKHLCLDVSPFCYGTVQQENCVVQSYRLVGPTYARVLRARRQGPRRLGRKIAELNSYIGIRHRFFNSPGGQAHSSISVLA